MKTRTCASCNSQDVIHVSGADDVPVERDYVT